MAAKRGRPAKQQPPPRELEVLDDDLSVEPLEEVEETPMMKVVERREYVRPMDDPTAGVTIETEPGEFIDDSDAAFSDFMSEADGQIRMLRVYKLKDTFRPGSQPYMSAQGSFCDEIPLTSDWLKIIKFNWGQSGGYFRVQLLDPNFPGRFKKHKLIHIEAPSYSQIFPGAQTPPTSTGPPQYTFNYPPAQGATPPDPMKQMRDQMSLVRDYAAMMKEFIPVPGAPAVPVDPNQTPAVVELRTRMEMFERIAGLSPEKQAPLVQLVKGLGLLGDDGESGAGDRWLRVLESAMPLVQMGLGLLMQRIGVMQPQGGVAPQALGASAQLQPSPQAPPVVVDPPDQMLATIYRQIVVSIQEAMTPFSVIDLIESLFEGFPDSEAAKQCQSVLTHPPAEVVQGLQLAHPNAERWINTLQAAWKEDNTVTMPTDIQVGGES